MLEPLSETNAPIGRILCLGAHCDDIEIGCGGTLLKLLEARDGHPCRLDRLHLGRRASVRGARRRGGDPRRSGRVERRRTRVPATVLPLRWRGDQGVLRRARSLHPTGPDLHPLPSRPAPGPPHTLGADLQHVARPSRPRVRDPQVGRRSRPSERLRPARRSTRRTEGRDDLGDVRKPAGQALVHEGDVPRLDAPARGRVQVAERIRGGIPLPEARARMTTTSAAAIVSEDLDTMVGDLSGELAQLAGKRLLVTGGAGFLGYYFVQAARRANEDASREPIRITVYDNYVRGVPAWLEELAGDEHLTLVGARHPDTASGRHRGLRVRRPRGGDRVADLLPPAPDRDDGRQRERPALAARLVAASGASAAGRSKGSSSSRAARSTAIRLRRTSRPRRPTAATSRAPGRARATTSRSATAKPCASTSRGQYGLPVRIARPFNNYGPGLKITDRRVIPDFARDILDGRDIVMLSDGSATRTFCYVSDAVTGLLQGARARTRRRGVQRRAWRSRRSRWQSWPNGSPSSAGRYFGYEGAVVRRTSEEREYLVDNPDAALSRDHEGARAPRLRAARRARRRAEALAASGTPRTASRRKPDAGRDRRPRATSGSSPASAWRRRATRSRVSISTRSGCARSPPAACRSSRKGSTSCSSTTSASGSGRRATSRGRSGDADLTMIAVGTPFDGMHIDLGAVRARCEVGRRGDPRTRGLPRGRGQEHRRTRHDPRRRHPHPRGGGARDSEASTFGVATNPEFLTEGQAVRDFMHPDRIVLGADDERTTAVLEELYDGFPGRAARPDDSDRRRDDQVRVERAPRDDDLVLERVRRPLQRRRRRRRRRRHARTAHLRVPHRRREAGADHVVPRGRLRLRRQLSPQGRPSPGRPRCRSGHCDAGARGGARGQRRSSRRDARDPPAPHPVARRCADRRSRARLQAGHRRRPRVAGGADRRAAPRRRRRRARTRSGRPLAPGRARGHGRRARPGARDRARRARTRSSSSPGGTSTKSCRTHSPGWIPSRFSWTVGVSSIPEAWPATTGSGAPPRPPPSGLAGPAGCRDPGRHGARAPQARRQPDQGRAVRSRLHGPGHRACRSCGPCQGSSWSRSRARDAERAA